MNITLLLVAKTDSGSVSNLFGMYCFRIKNYCNFKTIEIISKSKSSVDVQKKSEGQLMLKKIASEDFVILLDETGKEFSSIEFSKFIEKHQLHSTKQMVFVIGGAYGFSEEVYKRANQKISLSKMTFPHQLARVIFAEQLYRAMTILKREKYHYF